MAIDRELPLERRTDSARTLLGITQKAANANIVFVNPRTVRPFTGHSVAFRESPERGKNVISVASGLCTAVRCINAPDFAVVVACNFSPAVQSIYDSQPTTTVVPNRLSSVRELLHAQLQAWLPKFCVAVSNCDDSGSGMPHILV